MFFFFFFSLQLQASSGEGAFVSDFFPPHSCFFLSPPATCCSGRQSPAQKRGRKRREESERGTEMRWERKGTGRNSEIKKTQGNTRTVRWLTAEKLGVKVEEEEEEWISNIHPSRVKHMRVNMWQSLAGSHPSTTVRLTLTRVSSN